MKAPTNTKDTKDTVEIPSQTDNNAAADKQIAAILQRLVTLEATVHALNASNQQLVQRVTILEDQIIEVFRHKLILEFGKTYPNCTFSDYKIRFAGDSLNMIIAQIESYAESLANNDRFGESNLERMKLEAVCEIINNLTAEQMKFNDDDIENLKLKFKLVLVSLIGARLFDRGKISAAGPINRTEFEYFFNLVIPQGIETMLTYRLAMQSQSYCENAMNYIVSLAIEKRSKAFFFFVTAMFDNKEFNFNQEFDKSLYSKLILIIEAYISNDGISNDGISARLDDKASFAEFISIFKDWHSLRNSELSGTNFSEYYTVTKAGVKKEEVPTGSVGLFKDLAKKNQPGAGSSNKIESSSNVTQIDIPNNIKTVIDKIFVAAQAAAVNNENFKVIFDDATTASNVFSWFKSNNHDGEICISMFTNFFTISQKHFMSVYNCIYKGEEKPVKDMSNVRAWAAKLDSANSQEVEIVLSNESAPEKPRTI